MYIYIYGIIYNIYTIWDGIICIHIYVFSLMMKADFSIRLTEQINGNDFFSIGSFICYKSIYHFQTGIKPLYRDTHTSWHNAPRHESVITI